MKTGQHGGAVVSAVASQQEAPGFDPRILLGRFFYVHVLPLFLWVLPVQRLWSVLGWRPVQGGLGSRPEAAGICSSRPTTPIKW